MVAIANSRNVSPVVEFALIGNWKRSCQWNLGAEMKIR